MWHEYLHMLTDPSHWLFEFTVGTVKDVVIFGGGGWIFGRFALRRHDKKHHSDNS